MGLKYYKKGRGKNIILFLGGASTTFENYEFLLDKLAKSYTVIFPNYPGLGGMQI